MYLGLIQNSPFPVIIGDVLMRQALADREEIRFMKQSNGMTVCSYIICATDTFRDSFSREARGIVFDSNGQVIARPLHKFFNVNERPETQAIAIDWNKVARVMLKRDGSMIHTVKVDPSESPFSSSEVRQGMPLDQERLSCGSRVSGFDLKSKKSFESDVAVNARSWISTRDNYIKFCNDMTDAGQTAIFEWTSPTARIVVGYKQDELQLLHVRDNVTGEYFTQAKLQELSNHYGVLLVESEELGDPSLLIESASSVEGIEGWVIQFENGDMVKLKTKWYMDCHHAMTFLRVRDIARMVVDESLDDLKAKLVGDGIDVSQVNSIEVQVVREVDQIIEDVESTFEANKHLSRKDFAILLKGHKFFRLLMQKFSGKEPDYKGFFSKTRLDDIFDLTQINLTNSVAEVE